MKNKLKRTRTKAGFWWLILWMPWVTYGQGSQQEMRLSETDAPYGYYEYLPEDYSDSVPLVIFLHGLGEIGDGEADLWRIKKHGPPKMIEEGADFPAVVLSPQSVGWWDISKIGRFVDWAFQHYKIDTTRLYVTGISMGGGGTWLYARDFPNRPAAIVPICGAADASEPENLVNIPVWAFHNEGDPTVDVQRTHDWIAGIRAAGGTPRATIYPKQGHDAWTETYNNEEVWDWMFAQKLGEYEPLQVVSNIGVPAVYPNPFENELNIRGSGTVVSARLFNMNGKVVTKWTSPEQQEDIVSFSLNTNVTPGVYLLELESTTGIERFRVVKE